MFLLCFFLFLLSFFFFSFLIFSLKPDSRKDQFGVGKLLPGRNWGQISARFIEVFIIDSLMTQQPWTKTIRLTALAGLTLGSWKYLMSNLMINHN